MMKATLVDKSLIVDILVKSFETNKSVNYVIKQDSQKLRRIQLLMEYSFHACLRWGDIFLSDNKQGCALILYSEKRRTNLPSIFWDLKLALFSIGLKNILKTVRRESEVKKRHPVYPFAYLWFIGVNPASQGMGLGSTLLDETLQYIQAQDRNIFLETSALQNLPWYEKFGFQKYDELDLGYKLFFLKLEER